VMTSGFLYCWIRLICLPSSSLLYLHCWSDSDERKLLEGWLDQCVTSEAVSSLMHKRGTGTRSSNNRQLRKSGNNPCSWFDCWVHPRHKPVEQTLGTR
jgi:hypothetical protein